MPRRKQVYKITYPNGKIYVGMDLTGTALYMGSPSANAQIVADLELDVDRFELTLRKEILWESETATDREVRDMEKRMILETRSNDPEIGYNRSPRHRPGPPVDAGQ
ncbi:hypothetical protein A5621_10945 [Mycobacterium colombiense]|uniref:hypothetical protein n=1 Tax=Mycobacterium colombiense TaxID=339268 RepID=UPI0007FE6F86|nr:hypothetical protein [Mycobacterium colombiense]OBJ40189.1 hypothetical protein A5621_10945 [Mycobacterium colombiense]